MTKANVPGDICFDHDVLKTSWRGPQNIMWRQRWKAFLSHFRMSSSRQMFGGIKPNRDFIKFDINTYNGSNV